MATSLENVGNEFEIANHEITTIAQKIKVWCIWSELWPILHNFGYEIQNSVAMATSLVNFRKVSEIGDLYRYHQQMQKYWICSAYDRKYDQFSGIMTNFI